VIGTALRDAHRQSKRRVRFGIAKGVAAATNQCPGLSGKDSIRTGAESARAALRLSSVATAPFVDLGGAPPQTTWPERPTLGPVGYGQVQKRSPKEGGPILASCIQGTA